jgi:serine/threonine-protein kinase
VLGTPSYMSPEQAKGRPVDARRVVFAFGVMLYELSTGVRPFTRATVLELFIALDRDEPAAPSQMTPRIPPAVERVILRCLRKDPAQRYEDARAILPDLEQAAARPPKRGRARVFAAGVALLAAAGLGVAIGLPSRPLLGSTPIPMTALPAPRSTNAAAVDAYRAGLGAFRAGGDWDTGFLHAIELDPGLGAAHVQVAALGMFESREGTREHFRKADALRASLSERDRALLDAVEPVVRRQPSDWAEAKRRLAALLERWPGDAQLWYLLSAGAANFDDFDGAVRYLEKAVTLDPGFLHAWSYMGLALAYLGRFNDARAVLDRCLATNPAADSCLQMLAYLQDEAGSCDGMEATARQLIAVGAHPKLGYSMLASALAARGQPVATIREALRQAEEGIGALPASVAAECATELRRTSQYTSIFEGDFEAAERIARQEAQGVTSSRRQSAHGGPAELLASILDETGRSAEAADVALDFLDKRDAWEPDPSAEDMALARDATPALLRVALRAGRLSPAELASRRDPWLRAWTARVTPVARNYLWMHAYATVADSPEDARAALAALPAYGALPPFRPETLVDVDVGRTYLLAGRVDDAIPWLVHATKTCSVLRFPFEHVRAHLLLGEAREAKGDQAGACASYDAVVQRWGRAKPRSITAERAAAREVALRCAG